MNLQVNSARISMLGVFVLSDSDLNRTEYFV